MAEQDVTPIARAFLSEHVESVMQLELLLLLAGDPARRWTAAELSAEMRVGADWVDGQMRAMADKGLVVGEPATTNGTVTAGPALTHRFAPQTETLARGVAEVAAAYATRRVTVISLIFAKPVDPKPIDPLRSFADAFRIRRDRPAEPNDRNAGDRSTHDG